MAGTEALLQNGGFDPNGDKISPVLLKPNTDVVPGTIVGPNGVPVNTPPQLLTDDEARVLREYKKFLHRRGLREATFCNTCFEGNLNDGMKVRVTDGQIVLICKHRMLFYGGSS